MRAQRGQPIPAPEVGERIRTTREARGYSREELAAQLRAAAHTKTTTNTLGRWEQDGRLTVGELLALAELLDVPGRALLEGASEPAAGSSARAAKVRAGVKKAKQVEKRVRERDPGEAEEEAG